MASRVIFLVFCCAFTVVLGKKPCVYVEYGENALSSSHSAVIHGVNLLENCMDVLNKHRHHAVAFNHVTNECCGVPGNLTYTLISDSDWTAYTLNTGSNAVASTTAASTQKLTTTGNLITVVSDAFTDNGWSTVGWEPIAATDVLSDVTADISDDYTTDQFSTDMKANVLVDNTRVALFCGESGKFVKYSWSEAVSRCRSMGWWPAQLSTEEIFFALNDFAHVESQCLISWVGARANDTLATHVWTKSSIPVQTNFWSKSKPPSTRDYPFVSAHLSGNAPVLYGANSGLTLPSFMCTLEDN